MQLKLATRLILLWLICFAFSVDILAEHLPVKVYTSADGLGSSFIDYLMRDSRGFLWFCTRDGLSRFDGANFVTYRVGDKNSPPGIESIYQTRNGTYWIGTTGGLYRFKIDALSQPDKTSGGRPLLNAQFMGNQRGLMLEDHDGNLWFASGELYRVHERDDKIELEDAGLKLPASPNGSRTFFQMRETADGCLWFNTNVGLVRRLPDGRAVLYEHDSSDRLGRVSMIADSQERIWVLWGREFYVINPPPVGSLPHFEGLARESITPASVSSTEPDREVTLPRKHGEILRLIDNSGTDLIRRLFKSRDGHIWLSSDTELLEFDGHTFRTYGAAQGLPSGMAEMADDSAGNLWIAGQAGLLRMDRRGLSTYSEDDGLHSARLDAVVEGPDGTIYVIDGNYHLGRFDGRRFQSVRPQIPLDARPLWTSRNVFLSRANEWWVVSSTGLYRFSAENLQTPLGTYDVRAGLKGNEAFQVFEDKQGEIWVSSQTLKTEGRGLARFDRSQNKFIALTKAEGFPEGKSASSFAEDKQGTLWIGFYEGGLVRYANNRFIAVEDVPKGFVTDLHVDLRGRLWMTSSSSGVSRADEPSAAHPSFVSLNTDNGLSSNNARTITEDQYENIYVGTVRGVDRISPDGRVKHYSVSDGLAADFVVDSHCDRSGAIWFVTTNGLSRLMPTAEEISPAPTVWIGGIRISGVARALPELGEREIKTIELSPTQNNLQFDFFSLNFNAGELMRYQYRLEGADQDWSAPNEQRTVNFANLRPGTYRFLVRAVNSRGLFSEPAIVSFKLLPPVWQRAWFVALVILLVLGLLYILYRYRLTHLQKVNAALADAKRAEEHLGRAREERLIELERVRRRIATDLHDDIGASLTQIAILSEVAQQKIRGNGASLEPLKSIATVSNELVETMSDIVWAINPQKDHLQDLIQRMRRFASDILSARGISLEFNTPSFAPEIPLGANARREVFLIFKESLTNIVKHSGATQILIEFGFAADSLTLKIVDNGKGFDPAQVSSALFADQKGGHGILSMKKRAADLNGKFVIESEADHGTVITFQMPLSEPPAVAGG